MTSSQTATLDSFLECTKARRSYYDLQKSSTLSHEQLQEVLSDIIISTPTPFNAQSNRVVVLLGSEHDFLWNNIVPDILSPYIKDDAMSKQHTSERLKKFSQAWGTILCFVDATSSAKVASKFPTYAKLMPQWEEHSSGMLQYATWLALTAAGMGCNIQHYNPLIVSLNIRASANHQIHSSIESNLCRPG